MNDGSYVVEERDGLRVRLIPDQDCESPRTHSNVTSVVMVPDHSYYPPDKDGGRLAHVWRHLTRDGEYWPMRDAVERFERTVSILGGRSLYSTPHRGASCIWYMFPDACYDNGTERAWPEGATVEQMDAALKAERDEYEAWAEGDCWGWVIEESVLYVRQDEQPGSLSQWEQVEKGSCWGYIGYSYAEEEAKREFAAELARRAPKSG